MWPIRRWNIIDVWFYWRGVRGECKLNECEYLYTINNWISFVPITQKKKRKHLSHMQLRSIIDCNESQFRFIEANIQLKNWMQPTTAETWLIEWYLTSTHQSKWSITLSQPFSVHSHSFFPQHSFNLPNHSNCTSLPLQQVIFHFVSCCMLSFFFERFVFDRTQNRSKRFCAINSTTMCNCDRCYAIGEISAKVQTFGRITKRVTTKNICCLYVIMTCFLLF